MEGLKKVRVVLYVSKAGERHFGSVHTLKDAVTQLVFVD